MQRVSICPRCHKRLSADGVHTCTPVNLQLEKVDHPPRFPRSWFDAPKAARYPDERKRTPTILKRMPDGTFEPDETRFMPLTA